MLLLSRELAFLGLKRLKIAHYLVNLHLHIEQVVRDLFLLGSPLLSLGLADC